MMASTLARNPGGRGAIASSARNTAERWMAIPEGGRIVVEESGRWKAPEGSVLARTVSLELTRPDAAFLSALPLPAFSIASPQSLVRAEPVGTGRTLIRAEVPETAASG